MEALTENGIDLEMVQTTLRWIEDTAMFSVADRVDMDVMTATAEKLVSKSWTSGSFQISWKRSINESTVGTKIIADPERCFEFFWPPWSI